MNDNAHILAPLEISNFKLQISDFFQFEIRNPQFAIV